MAKVEHYIPNTSIMLEADASCHVTREADANYVHGGDWGGTEYSPTAIENITLNGEEVNAEDLAKLAYYDENGKPHNVYADFKDACDTAAQEEIIYGL